MGQVLSGKEARRLRGEGHHLRPAVLIGKEGASPGVVGEIDLALKQHELIKVKVLELSGSERKEFAVQLADKVGAAVAQILGKTILLYREKLDEDESKGHGTTPGDG